jgi:putative PIN family toxin of toxin-antitoxin system
LDVVIDTNVVISAAINRAGGPAQVIREWQADRFRWLMSPPLLAELERTLHSDKASKYIRLDPDEVDYLFEFIKARTISVVPTQTLTVVSADPPDNRILEAAVEGGADYIVTGDRNLLDFGTYDGISIVTPRDFLDILSAEASQ